MTDRTTLSAACVKMATDLGKMRALDDMGLLKTAGVLGSVLDQGRAMWLPAGLGYVMGGPEHRLEGAIGGALAGHLGSRLLRKAGLGEFRKIVSERPNLSRYEGLSDDALVHGLRGDSGLASIKKELLPSLRQYESLGNMAGGALGGFGVGKALSSQDEPNVNQAVF